MLIDAGTPPQALGVQTHVLADRAEWFHPGRYQRFCGR